MVPLLAKVCVLVIGETSQIQRIVHVIIFAGVWAYSVDKYFIESAASKKIFFSGPTTKRRGGGGGVGKAGLLKEKRNFVETFFRQKNDGH